MLLEIIAIILIVGLDQITKLLAIEHLAPLAANYDSVSLLNGVFELYYTENTGAAFNIFNNNTIFLAIISIIVIIVVLYFKRQIPREPKYRILHLLAAFIIGGAIGNLIDRIRLQYVVDMFHFYWFEFPIFNVADIFVTCPAILLILLLLTKFKDLEI